jgi:sulfonate transport system permease protein
MIRIRHASRTVNWLGLVVILGLLLIWQLLIDTKIVQIQGLASPTEIWVGLRYLVSSGNLWPALGHTIRCAAMGWAIAVVAGGAVGLLVALNASASAWTTASVDVFRSLPVVAFVPIAILVWGTGSKSEVILAAYAGIWPMLINTAGGVRGLSVRLREVASVLRLTRRQTLTKIVLPSTGAAMIVGARLALASSLVICVVAEMIGLQSGLGNQLVLEQSADQPARAFAYVFVIGLLGLLANAGLVAAIRRAFPGITAVSSRSSSR